jgi:preprotein translocase subunit YajC
MYYTLLLLAQAEAQAPAQGPPTGQPPGVGGLDILFMLLPMAILFYFLILRPEGKKQREQQAMLRSLKKGDKVLTIAGIYGTVVSVSETEDEVTVKVDDNARIKMQKGSISRNLTNEDAFKEAQNKARSSQNITTEPAART